MTHAERILEHTRRLVSEGIAATEIDLDRGLAILDALSVLPLAISADAIAATTDTLLQEISDAPLPR